MIHRHYRRLKRLLRLYQAVSYSPAWQLISLLIFLCCSSSVVSQTRVPPPNTTSAKNITRFLFVLDASSSMLNPWEGKTKMDVARMIIAEMADSLQALPNVQTALRVYGHQSINTANDCNDTKLEVAFGPSNAEAIRQALISVRPKGITPLARSLQEAAGDFPADPAARNILLLVTDGEESCGGDPCAVSLRLQQQHIFLKPFVIGLNLEQAATSSMDCIGNYYNAEQPAALHDIMKNVVDRIISSAAVRVNLLDADGHPLETDVNMTFYDAADGMARYNYYHTLNYRGLPDTLQVDPLSTYNLVIHTIPPVGKTDLEFTAQENNEVSIPASQGYLKVDLSSSTVNNNLNSKIKCIVRQAGSTQTVMVQDMNTTAKYLSGNYDLEVLTLPRLQIKNVAVTQSTTTSVTVDVPGVLNISKASPAYGAIIMNENGKLVKIYGLNENLSNELVGLQTGEYLVIYRPKSSKKTSDSITKTFRIRSGEATQLKL